MRKSISLFSPSFIAKRTTLAASRSINDAADGRGSWSWVGGTLLMDRYAPASLGWPGPVQGQGQGSPAIRISSSRQLQMVRQARQVGSPRCQGFLTGQAGWSRQMGIRLFPPCAVARAPTQSYVNSQFLITRGSCEAYACESHMSKMRRCHVV